MEDQAVSPDWLVVVGSSAGGIESLSRLVGSLPEDFPASIIIAQHLHPEHPSHLKEILSTRTSLTVKMIEGRLDLEPDTIYIAGPNAHVEVSDHDVHEIADGQARPMPSVNLLFQTAARSFGERLIAVILSGTGSDGAIGARVVKEAGGIVIVENPETSAYPQMALAVPPTMVDQRAELETIGPLLRDLVTGVFEIQKQEDPPNLKPLLEALHQRSGIDFTQYKLPTITRRLQRRLVATDSPDLEQYTAYLEEHPDEYEILANSFLIKVTEFFRDPELYSKLLNGGLKEIVGRALETGELRIWSAGCATGEEAYSLAIVVAELLGDAMRQVNVRIYGTDIDAESISYARRGIYPESSLSNLPQELIDRYFIARDGLYEVRPTIRSVVVFGEHDLAQRAPFPRIDLAMCRNVLIYFTPELQRRALHLFAFSLRDRGLLVLGKAETVSPLSEHFTLVDPHLKIYLRSGSNVLIPGVQLTAESGQAGRPPTLIQQFDPPRSREARQQRAQRYPRDRHTAGVMDSIPIGIVLVERDYQVVFANTAAREHLGIHGIALGDDLMHVGQFPPLARLRDAIDTAFSGEQSMFSYSIIAQTSDEEEQNQDIELHTSIFDGGTSEPGSSPLVMIQTSNVSILRETRHELEETAERLRQLNLAHRSLRLANDRLGEANRQLHADNEELLISNEEFQAAAEEVETLNEELQATNEELETLNEELQATIEELRTTNEELHARTRELERMAAEREE
ncbi:MAG: CheR family methyltransferase [Thermomicrobiales bacterium]